MAISTSDNDIKERLSIAYVTAVAARAGCQVAKLDIDKESIDAMIRPVSGSKAAIDLQLKASSSPSIVLNNQLKFSLSIKNYDDLRDESCILPHYLVVLHLPDSSSDWLQLRSDELALRGVAYYGSLLGLPSVSNTTSRSIVLPQSQRFGVEVLVKMIHSAPDHIGIIRDHDEYDRNS
jgi:Domain of unknown function (DUF4365)